jgi:beta-glucosidase
VVPSEPDEVMISAAVENARQADVVVCAVGDRIELVGEGRSTATLELQGGQIALLEALAATGTPMVVILLASKPLVLPAAANDAAALIWAANPGMLGGQAIAELLLGLIEPSGRLPISFARHVGQQPTYYNQIRGQHGDRYADLTQDPAFAFGEGLSYSRVEYSGLRILKDQITADSVLHAEITVQNTGERPVRETVQAYISDRVTSASWAEQELKAFQQVDLAPQESARLVFEIPARELSIVDAHGKRIVEAGEFELRLGRSSQAEAQLRAGFTVIEAS